MGVIVCLIYGFVIVGFCGFFGGFIWLVGWLGFGSVFLRTSVLFYGLIENL